MTMEIPPQVKPYVDRVDAFMAKYPSVTQYGTLWQSLKTRLLHSRQAPVYSTTRTNLFFDGYWRPRTYKKHTRRLPRSTNFCSVVRVGGCDKREKTNASIMRKSFFPITTPQKDNLLETRKERDKFEACGFWQNDLGRGVDVERARHYSLTKRYSCHPGALMQHCWNGSVVALAIISNCFTPTSLCCCLLQKTLRNSKPTRVSPRPSFSFRPVSSSR